ncbi:hypothetical protein [Vallitalea okinawensis]|uniref:hypothetical protein n=1 Tax=Vallitalea okinawensis TaxID=2078660 RepID=UPI000CFD9B88|nr:hypothetical protein [Vallitalea okinawensis]
MSLKGKTVIVVTGIFVMVTLGILAMFDVISQAYPTIVLNEDEINEIKIINQDRSITISDKEKKQNLFTLFKEIKLDEKLASDQVPSGWTYNVYFFDEKGEAFDLVFVGENVRYKGDWYKIDQCIIIDLHNYFDIYIN